MINRTFFLLILLFMAWLHSNNADAITQKQNDSKKGTGCCKCACLNALLRCMTSYFKKASDSKENAFSKCYQIRRYCLQTCSRLFENWYDRVNVLQKYFQNNSDVTYLACSMNLSKLTLLIFHLFQWNSSYGNILSSTSNTDFTWKQCLNC